MRQLLMVKYIMLTSQGVIDLAAAEERFGLLVLKCGM